jgi:AcrR family transcriptional regulator
MDPHVYTMYTSVSIGPSRIRQRLGKHGDNRAEKTHRRILDGAGRVLAERGLRDPTVQDILEEAGVSRRTFYQHFRSKEDLLVGLYAGAADALVAAVRAALEGTTDPTKKLVDTVEAYVRFQHDGGPLLIALQAEAIRTDSLLAPTRERALDALAALIDESVAGAIGIRVDPLVYRGLLMGIDGLVIHFQRDGTFTLEDSERVRRVIKPMFLAVILAARHMPGPEPR